MQQPSQIPNPAPETAPIKNEPVQLILMEDYKLDTITLKIGDNNGLIFTSKQALEFAMSLRQSVNRNQVENPAIWVSTNPYCLICKDQKYTGIILPDNSRFAGKFICSDCVRFLFDPLIALATGNVRENRNV